jgi:hypothetical protein
VRRGGRRARRARRLYRCHCQEVAVMRERLSQVRSLMVEATQALSEAAEPWPGSC